MYRASTMMRGSLVSLIYQKSLRLDITSPSVSAEGALTLLGTDTETIGGGIVQLHDLWAGPLEIAVGIYLLYRELGAACAMPVAIAVG
jgi:ATP-binding cassette, subfamily C (CFTR/MRP), member 1